MSLEERSEKQALVTRMKQQRAERENELAYAKIKSTRNREERALVAKGKNPYYLKKREVKHMEMEHKFEKLEESGKLDKYLAKRRKKKASKDRRFLPWG